MLVEEVPKTTNSNSTTVYFSSSINLSARPSSYSFKQQDNNQDQDDSGNANNANRHNKSRPKVNYNLNHLMNAQTQANDTSAYSGPLKSSQQIQLERIITKRLNELNKESATNTFEIPKNFTFQNANASGDKRKARQGNTPTTKKILSSRRNLNLYFEEERNLISINSILSLNYQFIDQIDATSEDKSSTKKRKLNERAFKPRLRLCCICGSNSSYARCTNCGLFACSVKCNKLHEDLRCN